MSWFSKAAPPAASPPSPPRGLGLVRRTFPAEEGLVEAAAALGADPVLQRLIDSLRPGQWVEARSAIGVFYREPAAAIGAAPAVAALLVGDWGPDLDGYAQYGLNEAATFLGKAAAATKGATGPGGRIHLFLSGPALDAAAALPTPVLQVFHRGMLDWVGGASIPPARALALLGALLDLPLPEADLGWHNQTRAEALRLLAQRRPPVAPPKPPTVVVPPPPPSGRSLTARLVDELRSGDFGRARLAVDLLGDEIAGELQPALEALLDDPRLEQSPHGPHLRATLLRRLARPVAVEAPLRDKPATARLVALAGPGSPLPARLAAIEALAAALPLEHEGLGALADAALTEADPALQRAGVGLWAALARLER